MSAHGLTLDRVKVDMTWRPQHFLIQGHKRGIDTEILRNAVATVQLLHQVSPLAAPVLTLRHLAALVDVDYGLLRAIVSRRVSDPYRTFRIKKRSLEQSGQDYRAICVPITPLMKTQRWIAKYILASAATHPNSYAYSAGNKIQDCARIHCEAQWLIKTDVRRFFESISEVSVYRAFRSMGYQPLISLELARISTRVRRIASRNLDRWRGVAVFGGVGKYAGVNLGHLPQGAPTSPMLSNVVAYKLDCEIEAIAGKYGLRHTRYADDIVLSSQDKRFGRKRAGEVISSVYRAMARSGFSPNTSKTAIVPPGARKLVLGLLVGSKEPRLTREFRNRLRQHCYYLKHKKVGPARHAAFRGFDSVAGLRNHVLGLLAFAASVDQGFARKMEEWVAQVDWPL